MYGCRPGHRSRSAHGVPSRQASFGEQDEGYVTGLVINVNICVTLATRLMGRICGAVTKLQRQAGRPGVIIAGLVRIYGYDGCAEILVACALNSLLRFHRNHLVQLGPASTTYVSRQTRIQRDDADCAGGRQTRISGSSGAG